MVAGAGLVGLERATRPVGDGAAASSTVLAVAGELLKPPPPKEGYVGSSVCAECHADVSRRYAGHPMGRSLARVTEAEPIEDYGASEFLRGARAYRVEKNGEEVTHHEILRGEDGGVVYDRAASVDYAVGSGAHGRSYLIDRGGSLFLSSIAWYSEGGRWDLAPGYAVDAHQGFDRRATDACLNCHAGRLAALGDAPNRYEDPPFLEESIGCERCHGPGRDHVERHRSAASAGERIAGADTIVNPADLDPDRREAVCYQCHLQGSQRVLRYGRTAHDFRPGDRMEDVWSVFVFEPEAGKPDPTKIVSQVEQMRSSRCFSGSEGRLGCVSCHDPHGVPAPEERRSFFDSRCQTCHADRGCSLPEPERVRSPAEGSCIACHMPRLPTTDLPHTSHTDHRLLREPEASPSRPAGAGDYVIFDGAAGRLPPAEVGRAVGLARAHQAESAGDPAAAARAAGELEATLSVVPDDLDALEGFAKSCILSGRREDALAALQRISAAAPDRESALTMSAKVLAGIGREREAVDILDRLLAVNPWYAEAYAMRASLLMRLGRDAEAVRSAEKAVEVNPGLREGYVVLAELRERRGDAVGAEVSRQILLKFPSPAP